MEPKWLAIAQKETGQKEIVGVGDNPRVLEYHKATSLGATSDDVAWCSSFVNWCFRQASYKGTGLANARSFLNWGVELEEPIVGCVAVFKRGTNPAQGHVAFYLDHDETHVTVLGGNQSNSVCVAKYKIDDLLGYRWPHEDESCSVPYQC